MHAVVAPPVLIYVHLFFLFNPVKFSQVAVTPVYLLQSAEMSTHPPPLFVKHPAKYVLH